MQNDLQSKRNGTYRIQILQCTPLSKVKVRNNIYDFLSFQLQLTQFTVSSFFLFSIILHKISTSLKRYFKNLPQFEPISKTNQLKFFDFSPIFSSLGHYIFIRTFVLLFVPLLGVLRISTKLYVSRHYSQIIIIFKET